jgi:hypothetical protein
MTHMGQARDTSGFSNMTPQQKADAFDASHQDPTGYAAANFVEADPPTTPIRVVGGTPKGSTGDPELPRRGKHRR